MDCKNCGVKVNGKFCSNCGQKTNVNTINLNYLLAEINSSFFQLNHGFFYTIKQLAIAPGNSIRDFIKGKRKNYFKPIAFILVLSTLYALVANFFNEETMLGDLFLGWNAYEDSNVDNSKALIFQWLVKNYAYTMLLLLPIFSLGSYVSFRRYGYNYFEHFVLNAFITGQQAIIYTFFTVLKSFVEDNTIIETLEVLFVLGYVFWTYSAFFQRTKKLKTILLTILTYFLYIIFTSIIIALVSMISTNFN